jgi:hypothetical protein
MAPVADAVARAAPMGRSVVESAAQSEIVIVDAKATVLHSKVTLLMM